jgi:hypothetical protein
MAARRSILEIHKPGLNQPQHDSKEHRSRNPEQERCSFRFDRTQQSPGRRHNDITVTQRCVIDRGVVKGGSEVCKFSADFEQHPPKCDLREVRQGRVKYDPRKNAQINPGRADTTEIFFAANKVDRGSDWQQVNNERAALAEHANRQGSKNRDVMNLCHAPT